ncbi:MAG: hypothetical protein LBT00_12590 [Spirochaetaceae bacterium]|nr:hypothetical protein [Spirochaetaceae bacterium]
MPFNPERMTFPLVAAQPSVLTTANLKLQLNAMGYTCPHTYEDRLRKYIDEGSSQLPDGQSVLVAVLSPKQSVEARANALSKVDGSTVRQAADIAFTDASVKIKSRDGQTREYYLERVHGSYMMPHMENMAQPLGAAGADSDWHTTVLKFEKLSTIIYPNNFDTLTADTWHDFPKRSSKVNKTDTVAKTDVATIQQLLTELVVSAATRTMFNLKKEDALPLLINRLGPVQTSGLTFSLEDEWMTIWALHPQPDGNVDALGAIFSQWKVTGKNTPGSSGKKNGRAADIETSFDVTTRTVMYSEDAFLDDDFNHVKNW